MAYAGAEFASHHPRDHWQGYRCIDLNSVAAGGSALAETLSFFSSSVENFS